jgi:Tfp pilus assembly protein PilV
MRDDRSRRDSGDAGFGLVEALVAIVVLSIGLLGIASIAVAVAGQTHSAVVRSDQSIAAQEVMERARTGDFDALATGTEAVSIRGVTYTVERNVTVEGTDVKLLEVVVPGNGKVPPDTFWTRVDRPGSYPSAP